MGGNHVSDWTGSRFRRRSFKNDRQEECRRHLLHRRHQELHFRRWSWSDPEHYSSCSGQNRRWPSRNQGYFHFHGSQDQIQREGWIAGTQRRAVRQYRKQDGYPRQRDLYTEFRHRQQVHRLSDGRRAWRYADHVPHDEWRTSGRRHDGRVTCGCGLSPCPWLCQAARSGRECHRNGYEGWKSKTGYDY